METKIKLYQCNKCEHGTVKVIHKIKKSGGSITVKDCDKCPARFGLRSVVDLNEKVVSNA